eukprot:TRINITY_DN3038_c0_g2_i2.p1 TRINITY_DN3038_c0_g2~~TRINITY_DN3038_c0_g2_i2.p1  ORF type:complete len:479 (+),score=98.24 TRINITY_DN3038_c0_g2_i2:112-1548(+)
MRSILCLALFGTLAFSQLILPGQYKTGKIVNPPKLSSQIHITEQDTVEIIEGFLKLFKINVESQGINDCISSTNFQNDVALGLSLLSKSNEVKEFRLGLEYLGRGLQQIPTILSQCKVSTEKIDTLSRVLKVIEFPKNLIFNPGKIISFEGADLKEIIGQISKAISSKSFYQVGVALGQAVTSVYVSTTKVSSQELVKEINAKANTWTATTYSDLQKLSLEEFRRTKLGARQKRNHKISVESHKEWLNTNNVPDSFDARRTWPNCIHPIRDQKHCGSCWAFAGSEVLSDRFCIASNESVNAVLSPQFMVSCDTGNYGCNGGYLDHEWEFLEFEGTVTDACVPYASGDGSVPACLSFSKCADGSALRRYYAVRGSSRGLIGEDAIKAEIVQNGPVETAFTVFEDFLAYKTGIYSHVTGVELGGHAVKIIGWGFDGDVKYWLIANSWNTTWGENGFFRIKLGEVGIDDDAIAGLADLLRR